MTDYRNKEFFKIGGSKKVTVTIEMQLDDKTSDMTALRNAREAVDFLAKSEGKIHQSWVYNVSVR